MIFKRHNRITQLKKIHKQTGAAVVSALLIVTLSALLASSAVWKAYKATRWVEHENARLQAQQIMLSAIEWAQVILQEDSRKSGTDTLGETWAIPLGFTPLDYALSLSKTPNQTQYLNYLQGHIEDAQGRFNLYNLSLTGEKGEIHRQAFIRLCDVLHIESDQAQALIKTIEKNKDWVVNEWTFFAKIAHLKADAIERLTPVVIWFSQPSNVNINTASVEVLYAVSAPLDLPTVRQWLSSRERASFRDLADALHRLPTHIKKPIFQEILSFESQFFLVYGTVQVQAAKLQTKALVQRSGNQIFTVWRSV
jgi:general secretion pathway protein K